MKPIALHLLLGFVSAATAATDPSYNSSFPYRPRNVTGLTELYAWVGSYYNATASVELTPEFVQDGPSYRQCNSVMNQTYTSSFESFLAITERGPQNNGSNPANMLLTLWKPGFNFSSLSFGPSSSGPSSDPAHDIAVAERDRLYEGLKSVEWVMASTPWTLQSSDDSVKDNVNLTSTSIQAGHFNLTGTISGYDRDIEQNFNNFTLDMEPCNSRQETKLFKVFLVGDENPIDINAEGPRATVETTFDSQTANLTLSGNFMALAFLLPNSTTAQGAVPGQALGPEVVRGKIKISFRGVIDPYRSDVLVNNSHSPAWIRTVGFGNNSLNIGYGESENNGSRTSLYSMIWLPLITTLILFSGPLRL